MASSGRRLRPFSSGDSPFPSSPSPFPSPSPSPSLSPSPFPSPSPSPSLSPSPFPSLSSSPAPSGFPTPSPSPFPSFSPSPLPSVFPSHSPPPFPSLSPSPSPSAFPTPTPSPFPSSPSPSAFPSPSPSRLLKEKPSVAERTAPGGTNLAAIDCSGRLLWWSEEKGAVLCIHGWQQEGSSHTERKRRAAATVLELVPAESVPFTVCRLTVNRNGEALALVGDSAIMLMEVPPKSNIQSGANTLTCKVMHVGANLFGTGSSPSTLKVLQATWHPRSSVHLAVLSSDNVFRLYDTGQPNLEHAEQELHLQLEGGGRGRREAAGFAFGGERLWERFTVFILSSDGAIFAICPLVPFGSFSPRKVLEELKQNLEEEKNNFRRGRGKIGCAYLASHWLMESFPILDDKKKSSKSGKGESRDVSSPTLTMAQRFALPHTSLALQGPLPVVGKMSEILNKRFQAGGLLTSLIGKDTLLFSVTIQREVLVHTLGGEVEPRWTREIPSLNCSLENRLISVATKVKPFEGQEWRPPWVVGEEGEGEEVEGEEGEEGEEGGEGDNASKGIKGGSVSRDFPSLLLVGVADFSHFPEEREAAPLLLLSDPWLPERVICSHAGGVDSLTVRLLPFSDEYSETLKSQPRKEPTFLELETCIDLNSRSESSTVFSGVAIAGDTVGGTLLVVGTTAGERVVERLTLGEGGEGGKGGEVGGGKEGVGAEKGGLSHDLLQGNQRTRNWSTTGSTLTLASVEGRTLLHERCKLLHEQYLEYAHRAYVELNAEALRLKYVVDDQKKERERLREIVDEEQERTHELQGAVQARVQAVREREEKLEKISQLTTLSHSPLAAEERRYRHRLDMWQYEEVPQLSAKVNQLADRAKRVLRLKEREVESALPRSPVREGQPAVPKAQMLRVKAAVEELAKVIEFLLENLKRAEAALREKELLLPHS